MYFRLQLLLLFPLQSLVNCVSGDICLVGIQTLSGPVLANTLVVYWFITKVILLGDKRKTVQTREVLRQRFASGSRTIFLHSAVTPGYQDVQ